MDFLNYKKTQFIFIQLLFYSKLLNGSNTNGDINDSTVNILNGTFLCIRYRKNTLVTLKWYCRNNLICQKDLWVLWGPAPKACSRASGYFFLGNLPCDGNPIKLNSAIHIQWTILKLVAESTAEAKLGALFLNAQGIKVFWLIIAELGHPQPHTPIHINNTPTVRIVNLAICSC